MAGRHTGMCQYMKISHPQIDKKFIRNFRSCNQLRHISELLPENIRHLRPHFKATSPDRRPDTGNNICRTATVIFPHPGHSFTRNTGNGATPTGMYGSDNPLYRIVQQHRYTIGRQDEQANSGDIRNHPVRIRQTAFFIQSSLPPVFSFHNSNVVRMYLMSTYHPAYFKTDSLSQIHSIVPDHFIISALGKTDILFSRSNKMYDLSENGQIFKTVKREQSVIYFLHTCYPLISLQQLMFRVFRHPSIASGTDNRPGFLFAQLLTNKNR